MFAVLYLPKFHLQAALRWHEELKSKPVAVVDGRSSKGVVMECSELAEASGVRSSMPGVQGLARCPELIILPKALRGENVTQAALLQMAHSLSPEVEATAPGCSTIDLSRIRIDDWQTWCQSSIDALANLNLTARIGVAPNPDLAYLAARN